MRIARILAVMIFTMAMSAGFLRADPPHDNTSFLDYFTPPPDLPLDPDNTGTPAAFLPKKLVITPEQEAAFVEAKHKAEDNKDWMLRGYEQQLQARRDGEEKGGKATDTNLYAELSSDKELAKAAGIRPVDFSAPADVGPRMGEDEKKPDVNLRGDGTADPLSATDERTTPLLKPLVVPLESPAVSQVEAPYALPSPISAPISAPISFDLTPQETAEDDAAENVTPSDPGAMDVPGMTAAESNPAMREALDLPNDQTPDALPMTSNEKEHHNLDLELPLLPEAPTSSDQLDKLQQSSLGIPGEPLLKKAPTAIQPFTLKPTVQPAAPLPEPTSMRRQLADPYDILR